MLEKLFKKNAKAQLKDVEEKIKKYPCHVSKREIGILSENVEEAFGNNSKEMARLNKLKRKYKKCKN